jgi:uncharacterized protein (TIGR03084 family)
VADLDELCDDLATEQDELDAVVAGLDAGGWATATPAAGWTVHDQIGHLLWFDRTATTAVTDPERFAAELATAVDDLDGYVDRTVATGRALPPPELVASWREGRAALLSVLRGLDRSARVPWYGPAMGAASFVTARLMETWAHGQDVVDGLGVGRVPTDRLRHVAFLGVRTLANSYRTRGLPVPEVPVRVEVVGPSGARWAWGEEGATDRVSGPALDFCLVVTQRRHLDDTALVASGTVAREWLSIAQAFAGEGTLTAPGRRGLRS